MRKVGLLFPHQLFAEHEILSICQSIYLIEEHLFFKEFKFHKQKLAFHRASMKCFYTYLTKKGYDINYVSSTDSFSDIRELLNTFESKFDEIHFINPSDNWLEERILHTSSDLDFNLVEYENPLFINSRQDLADFFRPDKKSFFQTTFYRNERNKRELLISPNGEPKGGKWSFDSDNRKKFPKGRQAPNIQFPPKSEYWDEAITYVQEYYPENPGKLSKYPYYPISYKQAENWFEQFLEQRFFAFGDYEDAIVKDELILHHSMLAPMLNTGLLSPDYVLNKSVEFATHNDIPINSLEGFVRQILGWREFIRGMYEAKGSFMRTHNFWGFERKIPASFYDGTTGIEPIDQTIKKVLKTGYCHHIERLMVLGNFMLLCEFHPNEVYRWFMELFIDAYDWVMVPNVYGMSQFADGGTFATKPYISGSNYLLKMSDYKKGSWQEIWDGLFWRFMHVHRDFFSSNPRLSMLLGTLDKMSRDKLNNHLRNAEGFLEKIELD